MINIQQHISNHPNLSEYSLVTLKFRLVGAIQGIYSMMPLLYTSVLSAQQKIAVNANFIGLYPQSLQSNAIQFERVQTKSVNLIQVEKVEANPANNEITYELAEFTDLNALYPNIGNIQYNLCLLLHAFQSICKNHHLGFEMTIIYDGTTPANYIKNYDNLATQSFPNIEYQIPVGDSLYEYLDENCDVADILMKFMYKFRDAHSKLTVPDTLFLEREAAEKFYQFCVM